MVVGGGFAGISVAVRLAKLRHDVVLVESADVVGGQLRPLVHEGFSFDHGRSVMTMPATLRDLFRKSGRPIERVLDLRHLSPGRRHIFADGAVLDLPYGGGAGQVEAIDTVLDQQGSRWSRWLDSFDPAWDVVRRETLDVPFSGRHALTKAQWRTLSPRLSLRRCVRRAFKDERLRALALTRARLTGQDPRTTPAFTAMAHLVERTFGRWQVEGGTTALLEALETRLVERRVDLRCGTRAHAPVIEDGTVRAVETSDGTLPCDVLVWAAPTTPSGTPEPSLLPAAPPARTYLGLGSDAPALPTETLVHAEPPLRVVRSATHSGPGQAWTVEHLLGEDPVQALARAGIDVRGHVRSRTDLSPAESVRTFGHTNGWQWRGWRTALERPGVGGGHGGLHRVGVNAHPGPGLELVAMGTAATAATIGKA